MEMFKIDVEVVIPEEIKITQLHIKRVLQFIDERFAVFTEAIKRVGEYLHPDNNVQLSLPLYDGKQFIYFSEGSNQYGPYASLTFSGLKVIITRTVFGDVPQNGLPGKVIVAIYSALQARVPPEPITIDLDTPKGPAMMKIIKGRSSEIPSGYIFEDKRYIVAPFEMFENMVSTLAESQDYNPDVANGLELIKEFKNSVEHQSEDGEDNV